MEETNKVTEQQEQVQQVDKEQVESQAENQVQWDEGLFKSLIETPEGKKEIQRAMDKHFTKGLETWKQQTLPKVLAEEMERLNPTDPVQRELKELKEQLERKDNEAKVIRQLEQFGIPSELSGVFSQASEEELKVFTERFNKAVLKAVNERLGANGGTPKFNHKPNINMMTKEQLTAMSYDERAVIYEQDPTTYKRIMGITGV